MTTTTKCTDFCGAFHIAQVLIVTPSDLGPDEFNQIEPPYSYPIHLQRLATSLGDRLLWSGFAPFIYHNHSTDPDPNDWREVERWESAAHHLHITGVSIPAGNVLFVAAFPRGLLAYTFSVPTAVYPDDYLSIDFSPYAGRQWN